MQQNELLYVEKEIANKRATFLNSRACPSGYIDSGVGFPGHVKNVSSISRVVEIKARITGRDGCNGECTSIFFYVSTSDPLGTVGMPKDSPPRGHLYDFWSNDFCSILDPESAEKMEVVGSFCSFSNSSLTTISMSVYPDGLTVKDMERRGCFLLLPCQQTKKVMFFIPPGAIHAPHFLREENVESVSVGYGYMEGEDVYYRETMPSFENVCGGVSLSNSSHICNLVSAIETYSAGASCCNILKRSKTAFGVCFELFTIYGNITLRRDKNSGGTVSFKGARNVRKVFDILYESLGSDFVDNCLSAKSARSTTDASICVGRRDKRVRNDKLVVVASSSTALVAAPVLQNIDKDMYPGFFGVHMAVVTLCLGKRLSVSTGNSMEMHVHRVLGIRGVGSIVSLDDDNNSIKIRILDWSLLVEKSREAGLDSSGGESGSASVYRSLGGGQVTKNSENTISVTGRGSVIVRLSWERALFWDSDVEAEIMASCWHLGNVLRNCC